MKNKISHALAIVLITGASTLPLQSANAWSGPWGMNMFGIDFDQSTGYGGYPGWGSGGPWGMNMFGLDFGQSTGYRRYYGGYGW